MNGTLIRKEISEHGLATAALLAFLGFCSLLISVYVWLLEAGSILDGHRLFMACFVVLAAFFVTGRLVAREYRGQTQLFLEALPVTRPAMISVKLGLGWLVLSAVSLLNLFWLAFWGSSHEPITSQFLTILTLRTLGFVSFVYLATFMMSMLGRYKIPLYLIFLITLTVFLRITGFELDRFGPVGLIWDRMEYEHELVPWHQLGTTGAICIGLVVLIYGLALVREGALAGMLAEKMSQREKMFITACIMASLTATTLADKFAAPEPFELFDMQVAQVGSAQVATSTTTELSQYLAEQLNEVVEYLHIEHPPKVWVTDRKDLDVHRFERAELKDHRSLLLRANIQHSQFDRQALAAFMIHEFLDVHTQGRVKTEAKMWYWDGFGQYWMNRSSLGKDDNQISLRAAVAFHDQPLTEEQIVKWRQYRRAVGDDLAQATAAVGLDCLKRQCGDEAAQSLLVKLFQGNVGNDLRATWFEMRNSNSRLFSRLTSSTYRQFMQSWRSELTAKTEAQRTMIAALPKPDGKLELVQGESVSQLHYALDESKATAPPVALLYVRLKPFEVEPPPYEIQRVDINVDSPSGEVDELLERGTAVLATLRLFDEQLGCERISGWKVFKVQ